MSKEFLNDDEAIVSKDKYYALVEATDYYEVKSEQIPLFLEKGKQPTVGDYIRLFKDHFRVDTEIKSFTPYMEFKVTNPQPKGLRNLKVLRLAKDFTYRPITKL
ncbi:hypothetical protein FHS18_003072 [Paenibacillus phyllosphaerae]|uniref:Uncharacterized protein n=1 Tax=Paenibacillus phyllosphaerae TaxID=274593 RepID=A0A7W5AYB3_9BACL|nr:hypothetical protein [Paenibacillus phyllosphaerae]MBB3111004.1 hypothetical protein [Paenibacillus phyllosphaerae]